MKLPLLTPGEKSGISTVARKYVCNMARGRPLDVRHCKKCGHYWTAIKFTRLDAQPPLTAPGLSARSQALARQTIHQDRLVQHRKWKNCPRCGSSKAESLNRKQLAEYNRVKAAQQQQQQAVVSSAAKAAAARAAADIAERRAQTAAIAQLTAQVAELAKLRDSPPAIELPTVSSGHPPAAAQWNPPVAPPRPPGWYVDPLIGPTQVRYWDGAAWTNWIEPARQPRTGR